MRILLINPPMTQVNTPYPATAYLAGFLKTRGLQVDQADFALELILRLVSQSGLERLRIELSGKEASVAGREFIAKFDQYAAAAESVVRFLQGRDSSLALRIVQRRWLPEGEHFRQLQEHRRIRGTELEWAFGKLGLQDQARHLATLFLLDLTRTVQSEIDPEFGFFKYGEALADSMPSFEPILRRLEAASPTFIDQMLDELCREKIQTLRPDAIGISAPFPGSVYGAFRIAREFKKVTPRIPTILGGGYCNTELRSLQDPRVFDYFDYVTLDNGEKPLLALIEFLMGERPRAQLFRTLVRENGAVAAISSAIEHDIPHRECGTPSYEGLPLDRYLALMPSLNPMMRVWFETRWNKLTLSQGCYWRKCSFCDVHLDYIGRYEPATADLIIDRMQQLIQETGQSGFHFVDEAAPPGLLRALSQRLIERGLTVTWWGNVRFDRAFTPELASLMARSGCIAVSGGLEVASNRLLQLMNKGTTVEQVARVTHAFSKEGILVHAYLMYGFPSQTVQETVDSLERVRQLFKANCIQSAYWHRFRVTEHSPIAKEPERFGIQLLRHRDGGFARYCLPFIDPTGVDHDLLGEGLNRALVNYSMGHGLNADVRTWFPGGIVKSQVSGDLIDAAIRGVAPAKRGLFSRFSLRANHEMPPESEQAQLQ